MTPQQDMFIARRWDHVLYGGQITQSFIAGNVFVYVDEGGAVRRYEVDPDGQPCGRESLGPTQSAFAAAP